MVEEKNYIDKQLWCKMLLDNNIFSEDDKEVVILIYMINNCETYRNVCFTSMLYSAPYINILVALVKRIENYLNSGISEEVIVESKWWNIICNGINSEESYFKWDIREELKEALDQLITENIIDLNYYKNNKKYFTCENISYKKDINYLISCFEYNFAKTEKVTKHITNNMLNLNWSMSVEDIVASPIMNSKVLYENFANEVIPIYYSEHILKALLYFKINVDPIRQTDGIYLSNLLTQYKENNPIFYKWNNFKFTSFIFKAVIREERYYKVFIDNNEEYWKNCLNNNYIRIGWDEIGDISKFKDYIEFREKFTSIYSYYEKSELIKNINELWMFYSLTKDDIVVAVKDNKTILGIGTVNENEYRYDESKSFFKHTLGVNWKRNFGVKVIENKNGWELSTIESIPYKIYEEIIEGYEQEIEYISALSLNVEGLSNEISVNSEIKFFEVVERNLKRKGNVILYGVPGSGKTYETNKFIEWYREKNNNIVIKSCSFYPGYKYENFVEKYENIYNENRSEIKNGIFKELCIEASKDELNEYFIIIDEINRGNIESIFGDMLNIIDMDRRRKSCILSVSGEEFYVPQNVYIIATMNISDKRVNEVDLSIRRFSMIKCNINYNVISSDIESLDFSPKGILEAINNRLSKYIGEEKQIGHGFFMQNGVQISTLLELKDILFYDIIPLIYNYCSNNYDVIQKIIGESFIKFENDNFDENDEIFIEELKKEFLSENI